MAIFNSYFAITRGYMFPFPRDFDVQSNYQDFDPKHLGFSQYSQSSSAKGVMYHLDFESLGQPLCKAGFFLIPESLFRG